MLRNEEELEGALLLPVATQVGGPGAPTVPLSTSIPMAAAATPMTYFDYDEDTLATERQQRQHEEQQQAYYIPTTSAELSLDNNQQERAAVAKGQQLARIKTEEELEAIRMANRKVYSQDYYAQLEAKRANERARRQDKADRQALKYAHLHPSRNSNNNNNISQMDYDLPLMKSEPVTTASVTSMGGTTKEKQQEENKEIGYKLGGYQTKEYQFGSSYETKDYGISEYKSVYD